MSKFPHLYTCSICESPVTVRGNGIGNEPDLIRSCSHDSAVVYANRKVTLRGKGAITVAQRFKLTVRQLLSMLTKRSV
jgi:hypothetical protein